MQAGIWDATFSKVDKSKGGFRAERQLLIPQGLRTVSLFASWPILCNRIGWLCWELVKRNPKLDALAIMCTQLIADLICITICDSRR